MNKLEDRIFNSGVIVADENYISEGYFIVSKQFLESDVLKQYTNYKSTMADTMSKIPYEKGEHWDLPDTVELLPWKSFLFVYNEEYGFSYEFIELFQDKFNFLEYYTVNVNWGGNNQTPALKIFSENEFVGFIMPAKRK